MKRITVLSLIALVVCAGMPRTSLAQTAKDIVQKAVDAHGGLDNLKKYSGGKATVKGKVNVMNLEAGVESEELYFIPDLYKSTMKLEVLGQKVSVVQIYNAGKVKATANGMAIPITDAMKDELKNQVNIHLASDLYPLLDEKRFEISVIEKPEQVGGKDVVGVLAKSKGQKDFKLFFDAKTFVTVKIERKGLDFAQQETNQQVVFLENKKYDGILVPVKYEILFDGKKAGTMEVSDFKHLDKVDKKEFDISD